MEEKRPKIPRNIIVIAFVALASGFGQDMITPVLPAFLALSGLNGAAIGLIDGLLQGATSILRFISGALSDRFRNRKWFVLAGYALSSISRPLLALGGGFAPIAVLRTVDGVGKGSKDAPRDALVADSAPTGKSGRAFGFHRMIDTSGSVFGPLLAAALLFIFLPSLKTYRLIFALTAIPGAVALCLIIFGIREPHAASASRGTSIHKTGLTWKFWLFTIGMTVAMLTKINDSLFLLRSQSVGVPSGWVPVLFAGFTLVYALVSYPIGIWSDRFGKLPFIAGGWLLLALVEFGFARDPSLPGALILFASYGLFYALTESSGRAFIADVVGGGSRGTAFGIYYTLTGVAVIAGGYGLGKIWDTIRPEAAFTVASLGSLLGFIIFVALIFNDKKRPERISSQA
jgi:MFS family permease